MSDPDYGRFVARLPSDTEPRLSRALADVFRDLVRNLGFYKSSGAGAVDRSINDRLNEIISLKDYKAAGDGTTNDRQAFVDADTAASTTRHIYVSSGTYLVNSNVTLSAHYIFAPGAIIKPASGVVVTLTFPLIAGIYQIFDVSAGGEVRITRTKEVWGDWWGAKADDSTDSSAAFQAAHDALVAPSDNGNGGIIFATTGTYRMSASVQIRNRVVIRGQGRFTVFRPTAGFSATMLFEFKNGTSSQFHCRLEDCSINGNDKAFSSGAIYAPSWNEHCGLRNVLIENIRSKGILVDNFYGGSATWEIDGLEVFFSASTGAGSIGVHVNAPDATALYGAGIRHCVVAAPSAAANTVGMQIEGDVLMSLDLLHFEDVVSGVYLLDEAQVDIGKITGGSGVTNLIDIGSTFVGRVTVLNPPITSSASKFLKDSRTAAYTRFESFDNASPFVFPPEPGHVLAAARCTGGATPVISGGNAWAKRISGVSRNGVGSYRFTLSPGFGATQNVHGYAIAHEITFRAWDFVQQSSTTFDVVFYDAAGAVVETEDFTVYVTHKP